VVEDKSCVSDMSPTHLICMAKLPNLGFQTSKSKIKESTALLYLDFLLRFGQVQTHPNGFFIFTPTSNPELDVGSGPYHHPNL
jgi:hypothetical protein